MATTIVHDLKNPLIAILAFSKRIQEGKGDVDKAAHAILDSAQTMQRIVEKTLDFARPMQMELKEEDMKDIICKVADACKARAEESGVNLSIRVLSHPGKGTEFILTLPFRPSHEEKHPPTRGRR